MNIICVNFSYFLSYNFFITINFVIIFIIRYYYLIDIKVERSDIQLHLKI